MPDFQFRSIDEGRYRRSISDPRADFRWRAELLEPCGSAQHLVSSEDPRVSQQDLAPEPQSGNGVELQESEPATQAEPESADRIIGAGQ